MLHAKSPAERLQGAKKEPVFLRKRFCRITLDAP